MTCAGSSGEIPILPPLLVPALGAWGFPSLARKASGQIAVLVKRDPEHALVLWIESGGSTVLHSRTLNPCNDAHCLSQDTMPPKQ